MDYTHVSTYVGHIRFQHMGYVSLQAGSGSTLAEQADGIMANELRAAIYAVEAYLPELRGATVRFMEDNQAVMFSVMDLRSNQISESDPIQTDL